MTAIIIILLSVILFMLVETYLMVKNAMEFMTQKLVNNNAIFEKIIIILDKLSKINN